VASGVASGAAFRVESDARMNIQSLEAGGEQLLYWNLKAETEGSGSLTATAESAGASDGMARTIPVLPHGMLKRGGRSGVLAGNNREERVEIHIPQAIDTESLKLELNCTPNMLESLAAALPYLADYPHGCTEQTLNRFLPSLVVLQTLEKAGLELKDLKASMPAERKAVYECDEIIERAQAGIDRLDDAQCGNSWWSWSLNGGYNNSDYLTSAWVIRGLHMASQHADLSVNSFNVGLGINEIIGRMELLMEPPWRRRRERPITNTDALLALVAEEVGVGDYLKTHRLERAQKVMPRFAPFLMRHADELSLYGKVLLAYAFELRGEPAERDELISFVEQYLENDPELGTFWLRSGSERWWFWYNDDIETMAWYLKLLNRMEPDSARTAGIARYLMINRQYGDHWKSTRDTAICIEALCEFVENNPPVAEDEGYELFLNGAPMESDTVLRPGSNELLLKADGSTPLFYDATWQYQTRENPITPEQCDLVSVSRAYYRLDPESEMRQETPLAADEKLKAGEVVEVELTLQAAQDLEYVLAQDFKPAGFECLETESGNRYQGLRHYQELHNERVSLYIEKLPKGMSTIRYRIRPEHAGRMSAMPATAELMYAPDQAANSHEDKLQVGR
jgi:uncharacterized protein YfaS (alpha-2-macroglobulin family)